MNDELNDAYNKLSDAYNDFKEIVKTRDKYLFERWKAGGFLVDNDIMSMYPNAEEVFDKLSGYDEIDG